MDVNIDLGAVLKRALGNGGEFADVFIEQSAPFSIMCEDSRIEKIMSGLDCGAGVRLIFGQRTAYAYTNELTTGSLLEIADAVRQAATGDIHQPAVTLIKANPRFDLPVRRAPEGGDGASGEQGRTLVRPAHPAGNGELPGKPAAGPYGKLRWCSCRG
jgi:PmbA/TldA metallopeptidase domain 1